MKKEKIIIIGGGGHARVVISIIKKIGRYDIIGYSDLHDNGPIEEIAYIGTDQEMVREYAYKKINLALGIGTVKPNPERFDIVSSFLEKDFRFPAIISPHAIINTTNPVGPASVIFDGVVVNTGAKIGTAVILNTNATVEHECQIADNVHISPGVTLCGNVQVGRNTLLGAGTTVIQGVTIGADIMIGAGALVLNDIDKTGTYFGVPAKKAD